MKYKVNEIDPTIISGCQRNDSKSQEQLFKVLYSSIFKTCMIYASSRSEAEDYLQNGFIKIFKYINTYNGSGNLEGWARKIVRNMIIDELRKAKNFKIVDDSELNDIPNESEYEILEEYQGIPMSDIFDAIQSLSPSYRTVFNLRVFDEMPHQEIEEKLGISEGASKSNYHKAKIKIIKILSKKILTKKLIIT